jgi:hypothetical protein
MSDTHTGSFSITPTGIGDEEYPVGDFRAVIGGEVFDLTRSSGDVLTIVARDVYGIGASAHNTDDTVQIVKRFVDAEIHEVANDLLANYTPSFNSGWITLSDWESERDTFLPGVWSTDICEPTGVNTLLGELQEQGSCFLWWDEVAQQVRFRALRPPSGGDPVLSEGRDFLEDSVQASDDTAQRVSRVFIYYDRKDPTKKLDEQSNYRQRYLGPDLESEGSNEYGSIRVKTIYSRWFRSTSLGRVQSLADTLLKRYSKPPRILQFDADMSLINTIKLADRFVANTRQFQDFTGANLPVSMQAIEMVEKGGKAGSQLQVKAQEYVWNERINESSNIQLLISNNYPNEDYDYLNLYDAFVAEYGEPFSTQSIEFIVLPGVEVGSSSTTIPAVRTGSAWPSGIALRFTNQGIVSGKGGVGGGAFTFYGEDGGTGFLAEVPIEVDNQNTMQGGGGGGGQGGVFILNYTYPAAPGGGGGGAGALPGAGGAGITIDYGSGPIVASDSGTDGTLTTAGTGGIGRTTSAYSDGGNGGNGGAPGMAGSAGETATPSGNPPVAGYPGGAAGNAVEGDSLITWIATGTRHGAIVS